MLEFLAETAEAFSIKDLAEHFQLPNSNICRLLKSLAESGYVEQLPGSRKYRVSLKILRLGYARLRMERLLSRARPCMRPLAEKVDGVVCVSRTYCGCCLRSGGGIGWYNVFIHKVFGPRVRIGTILTDAVLEPDPLVEPGTLCKRCMKCVPDCHGNAIPRPGDRPSVKIHIEDKEYAWGMCTWAAVRLPITGSITRLLLF